MFLLFFWEVISSYLKLGALAYRPETPYVSIGLAATLLLMIPDVIFFRKVSVSSRAITGHRYLGPSTRISWEDVARIEMNSLERPEGSIQSLRIISRRGQKIVFQSTFSYFSSLVTAVEARSPVNILQNPPGQT